MKRLLAISVLALLSSLHAYSQGASATEQEVIKAFHALADANMKRDRVTMERMTADDYVYTHSNGNVATKAQDIAETMSADIIWTAQTFDDLKVRIYGDVVVVTARQTLTGSAKGYSSGPRRITDLWMRRAGNWVCIGGQARLSRQSRRHYSLSRGRELQKAA